MKRLPLSKAQQRVWLEWKISPQSPAYNNPLLYRLVGEVKIDKLAFALQQVVNSHPALRCYFQEEEGVPKQVLVPEQIVELDYHDLIHCSVQKDSQIKTIIANNVSKSFDLNQLPLFRFTLIRMNEQEYLFILNIHHIAVDGYSASILIQDISRFYNEDFSDFQVHDEAFSNYLNQPLAPLDKQKQFWVNQFQDANFIVDLYSDGYQDQMEDFCGIRKHFNITPELTKAIKQLAKKNKTTDFIVLMAAFYVVLAKYSNQYDLTMGYAIDTRSADQKKLFGFFVNNIPLRFIFSPTDSFQQIVIKLTELRKAIKANQQVDYLDIIKSVRHHYPSAPGSLYNVSFIRANFALAGLDLAGVIVKPEPLFTGAIKDDLCLLYDESGQFEFEIEYRQQKYSADYIQLIEKSYIAFLQKITEQSETQISDIKLDDQDFQQSIPTEKTIVKDTIISRFIQHVAKTPHQVAIKTKERVLTYQELDQEVRQFIHYFMAQQLPSNQPIIICLERTPTLVAALLACQWLGIAYIPLDIHTPSERIASILDESKASVILMDTDKKMDHAQVIALDKMAYTTQPIPAPIIGSLAYIIYTSGSTGKPKGVAISHNALNHFLFSMEALFAIQKEDLLLAITTIAFDISGLELFLPLWSGASIYLADQRQHKDPFAIAEIISHNPITWMQATPAMWRMLIDTDWQGHPNLVALCGGEALSQALAEQLLSRVGTLWNMYGPTEATIWCTAKKISANESITIGKPIQNMYMYVMDEQQNILPPYVKGELWIGGVGLAEGYFNRDDLTSAQFFHHPQMNCRLYRTGDIACTNHQGEFIIFGRKDSQIKLNGYRIELNEIEAQLASISAIRQAAVIVHEHQLIACLSLTSEITQAEIEQRLSSILPDYMLPKRYLFMKALPLTNSGKIDRKAIPIKPIHTEQVIEAAANELESQLLSIWRRVLKQEKMGVTDNFYYLGGHSLLATQIISNLYDEYNIQLSLSDFFRHPTIRQCANAIADLNKKAIEISTSYFNHSPLTEGQKRFWFLSQLSQDIGQFHMAASIKIKGQLNVHQLKDALMKLCHTHDSLRVVITTHHGDPIQSLKENHELPFIEYRDNIEDIENDLVKWAKEPFELENTWLWRTCLISLSQDEYLFNICLHHIIADGYSIPLLLQDLWSYYDDPRQLLKTKMAYLNCIQDDSKRPIQKDQIDYWRNELADLTYLQLPTDYPRLDRIDYSGDQITWSQNLEEIKSFCQQEQISISTYAIACFALLLHRITQLNDFCIGIPVANRDHIALSKVTGCFVNMIPLRIIMPSQQKFRDWLHDLQNKIQTCMTIYHVPFTKLLESLTIDRRIHQTPLFSVVLNVQLDPFEVAYSSVLEIQTSPLPTKTSKYDLTMDLYLAADKLKGYCEYADKLFCDTTINNWCMEYQSILKEYLSQADSFITSVSNQSKLTKTWHAMDANPHRIKRYPLSSLHQKIASYWEELLNVGPISLEDNYFTLGGHSLLAAKLINLMNKEFSCRIPLETLFIYPEFEKFCTAVESLLNQNQDADVSSRGSSLFQSNEIPLTPNQKQLALLYQEEKSDKYHLGVLVEWPSIIDPLKLQESIGAIVKQHSIYQWKLKKSSHFAELQSDIKPRMDIIHVMDENEALAAANQFSSKAYDLYHAPLIRFAIILQRNEKMYLVVSMHHLIGDEWTLGLLIKAIYQKTQHAILDEVTQWQDHLPIWLDGEASSLHFWKNYLLHANPTLIPYTKKPSECKGSAKRKTYVLPDDLLNSCQKISEQLGTSFYIVLLAVYFIFLKYFTGESQILIATAYDRRKSDPLQLLHGYLVNLLPVSIDFNDLSHFHELVKQLNHDRTLGIQHADIDFAKLLEWGLVRKPNILFNYQHDYLIETEDHDPLKWQEITGHDAKFPFVLHMRNRSGIMQCVIEYDQNYYDSVFIENCLKAFTDLLILLPVNLHQPICDWQLIPSPLILQGNNKASTRLEQSFLSSLAESENLHADKIAIEYNGKNIRYRELWHSVKKLAHAMKDYHGESLEGKTIAIAMQNSDSYVISILATLYLGACFLPIDVNYPLDRQQSMITDGCCQFVITDHAFHSHHACIPFSTLMEKQENNLSFRNSDKANAAYIIYTSGSTGTPKGVVIHQRQLHLFIDALQNQLSLNHEDKVLQFASIGFDASIWEIFLSLYAGATLCIPNRQQHRVGQSLETFIAESNITHALLTPSVLQTLDPSRLPTLRSVVSGGEACSNALIERWANQVAFYNAYGPTEATICTNMARMTTETSSTIIGKALGKARLQVISASQQSLPKGAIGELLISGEIVTVGYVNPILNQDKFIQYHHERCYKSGDYVRILSEDQFEYRGRKDKQIKLRGLRIELNEIESAILTQAAIRQAVCHIEGDQLIAYIVADAEIDKKNLLIQIGKRIPTFMLPNQMIQIDSIPLLPSGKVDTRLLPTIKQDTLCLAAPKTDIQIKLHAIWQKYLALSEIGVDQDFFALGGNSLQAMQMMSHIEEHFQIDMPPMSFYRYSTIETQADYIESRLKQENSLLNDILSSLSMDEQRALLQEDP